MMQIRVSQLVDHAQKNLSEKDKRTFIESVKDFFNDLIGRIKELVKGAGSNIERQKFLEAKERCEQIRDNVLKEWDAAIENRQHELKDGGNANGQLNFKDKAFSLQFDEDGKQYIKIDEDILVGVKDEDVIKTVRNYIKENFPEGFEAAGYNVKNIGRGRKEYTSSRKSVWDKVNRPQIYFDKMRMARNLDEIISNVKNYQIESPAHKRKDDIDSFARGNILVEVGKNDYRADVIIARSTNNGYFMYDVVNIEPTEIKKASAISGSQQKNVAVPKETLAFNENISLKNKKVNTKETGLNPAANDSAVAVPEPRPVSKIKVTSEHKNVNTSNDRYSLNLSDKGQRYSANIDESLFEALDEIWALDEQKQAAGIVQKGFESLQNVQINDKIINKVAKNIIKEYGSTYDVSDLHHNLKNIFAYLKDTQNVSFEDMTKVMQEVAKPVLEQSTQIDESQKQDYEEFKGYLSKYKIKLNKSQREAVEYTYDNYNDFRKSMFGTLTLSNNGTYLDDIWSDIVEHSGYRLSYDTNDSDQIIELVDLMESMKPQRVNKYGMNIDNAAYDVALDIYRQFFVEQAAEEANSKVSSKVAELKEKQEEIRKKYARKYMEAVKKERLKTEEMQKVSILRLQDEFYRLDAGEREAIKESDLINAAVLKAEKEKAQNQIKRIRNQKNEKIADIRARNFASRTNAARQRKATYLKGQIKKRMNELNSMLTHPTEAKHIPVEMVRGVVDVCKAVNLDNGNSQLMKEKMDKLKKYYDAYKKDESFSFDYDENISAKIGRLSEIFNGRHYMQLNNDELQEVYNIVSAVKQQISNANKLIANKKVQEVHEAAKMAVSELEAGKGINNKIQEISHKYATLHLNARREFRKLSGYEDDSVMMSMYNQLEDGQKKQLEVERHVCEVYEDLMDDRKNMKKLVSTKDSELVDVGLKDEEGNPVKVTKAMRLSIIMHSYNKSNMYHILNDGFTVPDLKLYEAGKIEEAWKKAKFFIAGMIDTFAGCLLMGQEIYEEISAIIMGDKYYGMQVPIVELVNNTANDILKIQKAAENLKNAKTDEQHDKAAYNLKKYLVKLVESLCQFTGNPVQNDHNLLNGIYKWYGDTDADIIYGSADIKSQYDRIADAYLNGDMKEFDRLLEQQESILENPDNAINGVTKKMKERYSAGELSEEEFKDYLVNGAGKDEPKAIKTISDIDWKEEYGKDISKIDVLVDSYFNDKEEYKRVRKDMETYLKSESVDNEMTKKIKELYLGKKISAKEAKKYLKDVKGMSNADIQDKFDEWKYSQTKEGKSGRAYSKYNSLQDSISKSIKNPSADRQDIMNQIDVLRRKGVEDKKIKSAITSDFKEVYLKSNNKADIQNVLLTAYMYLGESKSDAMKKIQNWEKKAAEKSK